jgi:hypothetical protein
MPAATGKAAYVKGASTTQSIRVSIATNDENA